MRQISWPLGVLYDALKTKWKHMIGNSNYTLI